MYRRQFCKALSHHDVRNLIEAEHFAHKRGKPLTATISINPKLLDGYPADIGQWTGGLLNKLRIHCERAGFGYFAIWVRESYEGDRREHLHIMLYLPDRDRRALEAALRRWLPGKDEVVQVGRPEIRTDRYGRRSNKALTYMLKQMTSKAWFALEKKVRREKHCRETHVPVAAVLGLRCGVSRSLSQNTRKTFWTTAQKPSQTMPTSAECALDLGLIAHQIATGG